MGFIGYDQDDGMPRYSNGRYEITVEVTMTKRVKVDANPNDIDSINSAVEEWVNDNVCEEVDWDYEIDDIDEVDE